jgi:hypothetical protein
MENGEIAGQRLQKPGKSCGCASSALFRGDSFRPRGQSVPPVPQPGALRPMLPDSCKARLPTGGGFGSLPVDMQQEFDSIESIFADVRGGRMVVVVDDSSRENEG